jgi:hypothetical protein
MKRATTAIAVLMLVNALAGTSAARDVAPREENHLYNGARGGSGNDETNLQDLVFSPLKNERYALVLVDDVHNPTDAVPYTLTQDVDGDGTAENTYDGCGSTEDPIRIAGGRDINLTIGNAGCDGPLGGTRGHVDMLYFTSKAHFARWRALEAQPPIDPATFTGARRVVEETYHGAGVGGANMDASPVFLETSSTDAIGGTRIPAGMGETYVSIEIADASGLPTRAAVYMATGPGNEELLATICSSTDAPLRVEPGRDVIVRTTTGACPDGSPAAATEGTVTATFLRP